MLLEDFIKALMFNEKRHLNGSVLNEQQVNEAILSGRITEHSIWNDNEHVVFFSNNHIFGYGTIPDDFSSCSMSFPMQCTPRIGCEDGVIMNFNEWKSVFGQDNTQYIYSIEDLYKFIYE